MAGDWIKVEHVTPLKPEIDRIAMRLNLDHDAVVGKLLRFWIWADQQSVNGDALNVTGSFLDRLTNCPGFADALLDAGWLITRSGSFSVPHFARHNGQTAKSRALTKDRMKRSRDGTSVTRASPEKRREEKRVPPTEEHPPNPLPVELQNPDFAKAWAAWQQHRREIKKPLTATSMSQQLTKLAKLGAARAVAALNHSIANGWQGIFEPDGNARAGPDGKLNDLNDPRGNLRAAEEYMRLYGEPENGSPANQATH